MQHEIPDYNLQHYHFFMESHRAGAYADMKQPERALEAIRRAEAIYDPQWNEQNPSFAAQIDSLYAEYYRAAGNYGKALERFYRILRFEEESNRPTNVVRWKKHIAQVQREKGDYHAAADLYYEVVKKEKELNYKQFFEQLNELRTIYQLDNIEMESQRRLSAVRQLRMMVVGLVFACFALALIVGITVWSRRRIIEKNKGLFLQIIEHDQLKEELHKVRTGYENTVETDNYPFPKQPHSGNEKQHQLVDHLCHYLLYDKKFTQLAIDHKDIATALATNKTYLFEAVKTITGKTLQEYINYLRLEEARKMLGCQSKSTMDSVAMECGFTSYRTFSRLFKEKYKLTPTEYGKLAKNN